MTHLFSLSPNSRILLVSPNTSFVETLGGWLRTVHPNVTTLIQPHALHEEFLGDTHIAAVCVDARLMPNAGAELLRELAHIQHVPFILLGVPWSALGEEIIRSPIFYTCIPDWTEQAAVIQSVRNATQTVALREYLQRLEHNPNSFARFGIVGSSPVMQALYRDLREAVHTTKTVLVTGERGTGKELIAQVVHALSAQNTGPFVSLRCSQRTGGLLDTELFGFEKGSFLGARTRGIGVLERAHRGTLYLDNITALPLALQAKIARVVKHGTFRRIGGRDDIPAQFRLIASTHRHMSDAMDSGELHTNLFTSHTSMLTVPPLRQHATDIAQIAQHTVFQDISPSVHIHDEALRALMAYSWPDNNRELTKVLRDAFQESDNQTIRLEHLPKRIQVTLMGRSTSGVTSTPQLPTLSLDDLEKFAIEEALKLHRGNITEAVRHLGISRTTLYRKLSKYRIDNPHRSSLSS